MRDQQDTGLMGAAGTEVWVFETTDTGLAMIKMSYGRPWESGENDTFNCDDKHKCKIKDL